MAVLSIIPDFNAARLKPLGDESDTSKYNGLKSDLVDFVLSYPPAIRTVDVFERHYLP